MDFNKHVLGFSIIIYFCISCVFGKEGECRRTVWRDNISVTEVYCCTNFEMSNGTCIMCGQGFVSEDGGRCQPCTGNAYGTQCLLTCKCTELQICHHVGGCITLQSTSYETRPEDSTVVPLLITTSDIKAEESEDTGSSHGQASFDQNILIYSACITGMFVVITICYICVKRLRHKSNELIEESNRQSNQIQNPPNLILPIHENMIRYESVYDEIDDESQLLDIAMQKAHSSMSYESSFDETSEGANDNLKNGDYLNPYQPIVQDHERHYYNSVTDDARCIQLEKNEDNDTFSESNEEIPFENLVIQPEYLDVSELSRDNQNKACNSGNAKIVYIRENDNQGTSQLNMCQSRNCKINFGEDNKDVSELVSIKRLTI